MKATLLLLAIIFFSQISFAYEGVVHGVKTINGTTETFDIFIKGDKICVEGTNTQGYFKIIFDRGSDEITICMDSPLYNEKGYFKVNLAEKSTLKKIEILSSNQKTIEQNGETLGIYSAITNFGSAALQVNPNGNADLSGLSKYLEDPVYELIDHYNIKNSIKKIEVDKPLEKYTITLSETEKTLENAIFDIPSGYALFEIEAK